jgi:hypothetical protein
MPDNKKIIIDEDWKTQVQAEKEAAKKPGGEPAANETKVAEPSGGAEHPDPPMPPASFEMLVSTLATETLAALGQFPHPVTGQAELHRNQAQYLIDTLDMLRQKSQGNLTPAEQQLIESVLHQLRMVFVAAANQPAPST